MSKQPLLDYRAIEVRGFKWPHRATHVATTYLLGEDGFGRWLGIRGGGSWHFADGSRSGVFERSFVKLVPADTWWTACFHPVDPVIDVDIVFPVHWAGDVLEELDLELDVLRSADGRVDVRDWDKFDEVRVAWAMPAEIAAQAETTCEHIRARVERCEEPFGAVGRAWLARFLTSVGRES